MIAMPIDTLTTLAWILVIVTPGLIWALFRSLAWYADYRTRRKNQNIDEERENYYRENPDYWDDFHNRTGW
jgi:hypothetical protein